MRTTLSLGLIVILAFMLYGCGAIPGGNDQSQIPPSLAALPSLPDPDDTAAYEVQITRAGTAALLYGWNTFVFPAIGIRTFDTLSATYRQDIKLLKAAADCQWIADTTMYYRRHWYFQNIANDASIMQPGVRYWLWCNKKGTVINFDYPVIHNLMPAYAFSGTTVTLAGANFGSERNISTVKFGACDIDYNDCIWSATQISCKVPQSVSETYCPVTVTVNGHCSNTRNFYAGIAVIYVKPDGRDYNDGLSWENAKQNIQPAIDASLSGGSILVADGTYTGLIINEAIFDLGDKNLTLQSSNGPQSCILDGENLCQGAVISGGQSNATIIQGFSFKNCRTHKWNNGMAFMIQNNSNPEIVDCIISDCSPDPAASDFYGAGVSILDSSPVFKNCYITNNSCFTNPGYGGGICCFYLGSAPATPQFINCNISNNSSRNMGGGIFIYGGGANPLLTNCTLANNTSASGNAIRTWGSTCTINNSIIWGNDVSGSATVQFSDIQGGWGGTGNLNADPLFIDSLNKNYRLQNLSPGVDTGNNALLPPGITLDLDGNPRIINAIVDMGCYERQPY